MTAPAFPILKSVAEVRAWRATCQEAGRTVGFVPTMGALHAGHLSLVQRSLNENSETIVSIFVNPTQFAPTEDLSTYPRPLSSDLSLLSSLSSAPISTEEEPRTVSALFLPPVEALYPGGTSSDIEQQRGAFIQVEGLQDAMEGSSRPGFFRGVATVCLKLFNIVQPTRAYFGQKDIQQALLLRRLLSDLHLSLPSAQNLIIHPTYRHPTTHLALSSRNVYLSEKELGFASILIDALQVAEKLWYEQRNSTSGTIQVSAILERATLSILQVAEQAKKEGVQIQLMYVLLNDPVEMYTLSGTLGREERGAVLSGAVMLGKTRLIDNLVFEYNLN